MRQGRDVSLPRSDEVSLQNAVALLECILGEEVAHEIEDGAVADGEALLDRFVTAAWRYSRQRAFVTGFAGCGLRAV